MREPRVSVLIATADRTDLLARCLEHFAQMPHTFAEILVLDQSRDPARTAEVLPTPTSVTVRHFLCPRRGKSAALNIGVREAQGRVLAFTDDDCLPARNWLEVIDRACREGDYRCALTGRVLAGKSEGSGVKAPSLREEPEGRVHRKPEFRDVLFGNNMAIPVELLRRVGSFDEALGPGTPWRAAEDNDLGYRLLRAGVPIRYLPDMVVTHRSWRTGSQQVELFRAYGLGQGAFYGKHARRGDLHILARMVRNFLDAGRDLGGAALLGKGHHVKTSGAFAVGLVSGFVQSLVSFPDNGAGTRAVRLE